MTSYTLDFTTGAWQHQVKFILLRHLSKHFGFPECPCCLVNSGFLFLCTNEFRWRSVISFLLVSHIGLNNHTFVLGIRSGHSFWAFVVKHVLKKKMTYNFNGNNNVIDTRWSRWIIFTSSEWTNKKET